MVVWTKDQKKIFDLKNYKNGKIVVNACPGSGKTKCVSERIYKFINNWKYKQCGLLILSFTNVAVNEIKNCYWEKTKNEIDCPHYIGTFDKFINDFIFLPFGYLAMNCKKRPKLVGLPYSNWVSMGNLKDMDKFSYDKNGNLKNLGHSYISLKNAEQYKKIFNKKGYANQEDANYFSMKVLLKYPKIAKSIVNRFPYLIVDETQDLSETQMEILNILEKNGLKNILLLGDSNQAIFEWKLAKPNLFIEESTKSSKIELNYTFRCGKNISEKLSKLSNQKILPSENNCQNDEFKLIPYNNKDLSKIIQSFNKIKCNGEGFYKGNNAILYRSNQVMFKNNRGYSINEIFNSGDKDYKNSNSFYFKEIEDYTKNIISAECYLLNNDYINFFKEFEKAYVKIKTRNFKDVNEKIRNFEESNFYQYKIDIFKFIKNFDKPNENQLVDKWIKKINEKNITLNNKKIFLNKIKLKHHDIKNFNKTLMWKDLLNKSQNETNDIYCGTIHSAKGKTFDNVLLILNSHSLKNLKEGNKLIEYEELRNVYVGMSRAKNGLWIAVPENDFEKCNNFFYSKQASLDSY
jgi:DNA helicase-2/ATP-dependent DNA helicase PcrA